MADKQWYFNMVTGEPELGPLSPVDQRMGPYASKQDALDAWEIVKKRNKAWDDQERQWDGADWNSDSESEDADADGVTHADKIANKVPDPKQD